MLNYLIRDLKSTERPRERLIKYGAVALSDSEILAILLRSGGKNISALDLAKAILNEFGGLKQLINVNIAQLTNFKNIGVAKATCIKAACEIALRIGLDTNIQRQEIKGPDDVFRVVRKELFAKQKEHLILISLDSRNKLISKDEISVGTVNETLVHPREVFKKALSNNAVSVILVHNHPSNDTSPSTDDIKVTERIAQLGINLGIAVLDHIIVSDGEFTSLKSLNLFKVKKLQ